MKKNRMSDFEINSMIDDAKGKFKTKLNTGHISDIKKFNSTEEKQYHELGPGGRTLIKDDRDVLDYSEELQRSPDIYSSVKRKLKELDDLTEREMGMKNLIVKTHDDQSESASKEEMMRDKPDLPSDMKRLKKKLRDRALFADGDNYQNMSDTFDTNAASLIKKEEGLLRNQHQAPNVAWKHSSHTLMQAANNSRNATPRRLKSEKKKEKKSGSKEKKVTQKNMKHKIQLRIGLCKNYIKECFNGGDLLTFRLCFGIKKEDKEKMRTNLVTSILKKIQCVDPKKTNVVTNPHDYEMIEDEDNCLDFEKKIYTKWVKYLKKEIKWPALKKKLTPTQVLNEHVLDIIDKVSDNLEDNGKWTEPKKEEKRIRRLNGRSLGIRDKVEENRRLNSPESITRDENNTIWDNDINKNIDSDGNLVHQNNLYGRNDEEEEAHKIALLEHTMSKKLNKLFKIGENKKKGYRTKDNLVFAVDSTKKYDMLEGIGKSGFKKIDFSEERVLRGMAVYHRLDSSIKLHTNWFKSGVLLKTIPFISLIIYFLFN